MNSISIITVNKNNAIGLISTIKSVIKHKVASLEFIIIDGGSTDNSVEIIKENISNIDFWLSELDGGIYEAMNKGIRNAKNDYLLFLNSGDFLVDNFQISNFKNFNSDIIIGSCEISEKGKIVHITNPPKNVTLGTLYYTGLPHQSVFIKRDLFFRFGLYREEFRYHGDSEFWYRTIILGNATTDTFNHIVSNYNLEGISSTLANTDNFLLEQDEILNHNFLRKVMPDYYEWEIYKEKIKPLIWLESKKILFVPILMIFKIAVWFNSKK